ncbi:MAG: hypothetical protein OXF78_04405 [Rhodospirillales bacterium]|nr:hypothetical protein [Rhodospirillales bacterium]
MPDGRVARPPAPRGRTFRCTAGEHAQIVELAAAAGTSVSRYLIACALQDDEAAAQQRLALTPDEQRTLVRQVGRLDALVQGLERPMPGSDLPVLDGVRLLMQVRRRRSRRAGAGSS